jgi:predicted porin
MKKSVLAIAVLGAFAGAASAQSSVTISGFVDANVIKNIGTTDKTMGDSGGSRLNFRGSEDLGGGLRANFGLEHRLTPGTGASTSAAFWNGFSTVGLSGSWGRVDLGHQYTPAFIHVQNKVDPFLGDTVADLRDVGMRFGALPGTATAPSPSHQGINNVLYKGKANTSVRVDNSIRYDFSANGLTASVSVAEQGTKAKRPTSFALTYGNGPLWVGYGFEANGDTNAKANAFGLTYNFGPAKLAVGANTGKNGANNTLKGTLVGVTVPLAGGDFKFGLAQAKMDGTVASSKTGIGYHYYLSKLTQVYVDAAKDSKAATSKTGYNAGVRVAF